MVRKHKKLRIVRIGLFVAFITTALAHAGPLQDAVARGDTQEAKRLLQAGADVNAQQGGALPLCIAARKGFSEIVRLLCDYGAHIDQEGPPLHKTPLCTAVINRHSGVVRELCKRGADVNRGAPLAFVFGGDKGEESLAMVQFLCDRGADINFVRRDSKEIHLLRLASRVGHWNVVRELYERGATTGVQQTGRYYHTSRSYPRGAEIHLSGYLEKMPPEVALIRAVYTGNLAEVKKLISDGINIESRTHYQQRTLLHIAALKDCKAIVEELLLWGAQTNAVDVYGCTPLHYAAEYGHADIIGMLYDHNGLAIDKADNEGQTALERALMNDRGSCVKALAHCGARIANDKGYSILHKASKGGLVDSLSVLCASDMSVNIQTRAGLTPVYCAAKEGKLNSVRILCEYGADINIPTNKGITPLYCAGKNEHQEVVRMLLENGARHDLFSAAVLGEGEQVARLIGEGVEVNARQGGNGWAALYAAAKFGHLEIVQMLCEAGADINSSVALHTAVWEGYASIVEELLARGAHVDVTDDKSFTALHYAAQKGFLPIVEMLCNAAADRSLLNSAGKTALELAREQRYREVVQFLVSFKSPERPSVRPVVAPVSASSTPSSSHPHEVTSTPSEKPSEGEQPSSSSTPHASLLSVDPQVIFPVVNTSLSSQNPSTGTSSSEKEKGKDAASTQQLSEVELLRQQNKMMQEQMQQMQAMMAKMTERQKELEARVATPDKGQHHACIQAVMYGEQDKVQQFLRQGIAVDMRDEEGKTLLHLAVQNRSEAVSIDLIQYSASLNALVQAGTDRGKTPLHFAVMNRLKRLAESLIIAGASVHIPDIHGARPLHWAVAQNDPAIVKLLLEHGAQADVQNDTEQTPRSLAQSNGNAEIIALIAQKAPEEEQPQRCCICLDTLEDDDQAFVVNKNCGHVIHRVCSYGVNSCPHCRAEVGAGDWLQIFVDM